MAWAGTGEGQSSWKWTMQVHWPMLLLELRATLNSLQDWAKTQLNEKVALMPWGSCGVGGVTARSKPIAHNSYFVAQKPNTV